ncbi:SRPBCC domain-containing protein [Mesorhizobium sp. M1006]|uniref:SRPBCC family protein n=1 Tax=Mesorhizobium sp. M1006 TaxID=2957048 RepID=UPI003338A225
MLAGIANTDLILDRDKHTIILTRVLAAPCEQVFEAWTQPEHVACWWDPSGEPLAQCEIDLRPGGAFRFVNRHPPGANQFAGVYREIAPPRHLVFEAGGDRACHSRRDWRQDVSDGEDRVRLGGTVGAIS